MDAIDYRRLPPRAGGYSELFLDFIYDFEKVQQFFQHDFRSLASWQTVADSLSRRSYDRSTLISALEEQNSAFGSPSKTFDHIALLEKPTTFAVVTGQQVGLFGGPLYTLYKTVPKSILNPNDKAFAIMDALRKQTFKSVRRTSTKTHILIWKEK